MAATSGNISTTRKLRWYAPTPAKFLFAVLVMQGVLFLSAHYRWFWFNERKGYTVLITVAATVIGLLLLIASALFSRLLKSKAQFSLATLLLMVPVMGIPCAWLAREMVQARQQRDLFRLAFSFETDPNDLSKSWITEFLGPDFFRDLVRLELGDPRDDSITDAHMKKLTVLTQLRELYVAVPGVTDHGLEDLESLTQLDTLHLTGTQVTDAGLEHLKGLTQLQWLDLRDTQITDSGLEQLTGLTQLISLNLELTQVTDAGLEHLEGLTSLQYLYLNGTKVTDAGLGHLKGLTQLQRLSLRETQVTDAGIDELKVALPNCKIER